MRRMFVRGIWGDISANGIRDGKIWKDIQKIKENRYNENFVVIVFGEKNAQVLKAEGFDTILIDANPVRYDIEKLYRHKLDILEYAFKFYDEIVYLDWDCTPTAHLPRDFWDKMHEKAPFQANLLQYRTKKCLWRNKDWRKVCNGGFLYIREAQIATDFINKYNELAELLAQKKKERESQGKELRFREKALVFDDEPAFSKWIDDYSGGWPGEQKYWELFEPHFCNLRKKSAFSPELLKTKNECFVHWAK